MEGTDEEQTEQDEEDIGDGWGFQVSFMLS